MSLAVFMKLNLFQWGFHSPPLKLSETDPALAAVIFEVRGEILLEFAMDEFLLNLASNF